MLAAIGFSLALCEAGLRIFYPDALIQDDLWPAHLSVTFRPVPGIMPGVFGESRFTTNSNGIRGDELSGRATRRILAVGGSATECLYLSQEKSWPYLLQTKLNSRTGGNAVWVGNTGMSGANTNDHVKLLKYFPCARLKIDTLVVLIGVNDFLRRLALDKDFGKATPAGSQTVLGAIWSKTQRALSKPAKEITEDNAGIVYVGWRQNRHDVKELIETLPDLNLALQEYRRNVHAIIDLAKKRGMRVIFLTQPAMWSADLSPELQGLLWMGGIGDFQARPGCAYYSVKALGEGMSRYNDALISVCRARGVECIDLAGRLPKDTSIFYDDCHFNENGANEVAEIVSRYLQ